MRKKKENPLFSIYDPLGVKLLTHLRLEFSHLNERKFRHGFGDTINAMCTCGSEAAFLLRFSFSCVAIFILQKDENSLKTSKKLTQVF